MGAVRSPTLPNIDAGALPVDRGALVAALRFVEGVAAGWTVAELRAWLAEDMVAPGRMTPISVVHEAAVGSITLDARASSPSSRGSRLDELPKLLAMSRSRVVVTLRAFIAVPPDDRFLQAAIYQGRVQRATTERGAIWLARPSEQDFLADIVLSLFAADVLMHRDFHDEAMCVCSVCGRVSFAPTLSSRTGCAEHPRPEAAVQKRSDSGSMPPAPSRK